MRPALAAISLAAALANTGVAAAQPPVLPPGVSLTNSLIGGGGVIVGSATERDAEKVSAAVARGDPIGAADAGATDAELLEAFKARAQNPEWVARGFEILPGDTAGRTTVRGMMPDGTQQDLPAVALMRDGRTVHAVLRSQPRSADSVTRPPPSQ